jgi:hypothetical protein
MFVIKNEANQPASTATKEYEVFSCDNYKVKSESSDAYASGCSANEAISGRAMPVRSGTNTYIYMYDESGDIIRNIHVDHRAYVINSAGKTIDTIYPS